MVMMFNIPTRADIEEAHLRIQPHIRRTEVMNSSQLDRILGANVFFKCENLQVCGVFKPRGASNVIFSLTDEEVRRGVATHSSGNHAQALAYAAKKRGMVAYIVMPKTAPGIKIEAVKSHGGRITFCEPTQEARESTLERIVEETGARFIHPYDDPGIVAGQATSAMEFIQDISDLDILIGPVGGGGLMSGTCLSARIWSPGTRLIGAEPKGADDAHRSLKAGHVIPSIKPDTIADGLLTSLGEINFHILNRELERIVTVSEENIIQAMKLIHEHLGMKVEPSGAVSLAALLEDEIDIQNKMVGIMISGGNISVERFGELTGV